MTDQPRVMSEPARFDRRQILRLGAASAGALLWTQPVDAAAPQPGPGEVGPAHLPADVPLAWFDLASELVRTTAGFTPPVAARTFGYMAVALYQTVVPGMPSHQSLAGQLDGWQPDPSSWRVRPVHWGLAANAALAGAMRGLLPADAPDAASIDRLEERLACSVGRGLDPQVVDHSRRHGDVTAAAVVAWSAGDGGHDGHLRNVSDDYVPPSGPGQWRPTPPDYVPALQPTWGANRTMVPNLVPATAAGPPVPYSEEADSEFFAEATEVYETVNALTPDQLDIARFWSDDAGGVTATPAGHSVSILSQVLTSRDASLGVAAEAYARLGIALSDAFVCCWATKYEYSVLRPITYVRDHIDSTWGSSLPLTTPPFPEHTSGHSVQSAAMARVLAHQFGTVEFTDHTHDARGLAPRRFASFEGAAREAAISRLFGGIHYRRAIEEGLRQGGAIGDAVNRLPFAAPAGNRP